MTRMLCAAVAVGLVADLAGCRDEAANRQPPPQRLSERQMTNLTLLQDAPPDVQIAFERDFPAATVERMQTISPQSGPLLYQISFIHAGQPRSATYTRNGERIRTDAAPPPSPPADLTPPPR